ncbi:hypothetical protein LSTR_LSTR002962 [Laodelphax striatellus]|uniref:Uncharacterized protein n=1 Tax=Laodelphax striatellus TaxID=195883 RepID=A0A482XM78_LAOST|nr:hypothetical protein LSTR_LSTR002962 [Laodelphax striatellus]
MYVTVKLRLLLAEPFHTGREHRTTHTRHRSPSLARLLLGRVKLVTSHCDKTRARAPPHHYSHPSNSQIPRHSTAAFPSVDKAPSADPPTPPCTSSTHSPLHSIQLEKS